MCLVLIKVVFHVFKMILRPVILASSIFILNIQRPLAAGGCSGTVTGASSWNVEKRNICISYMLSPGLFLMGRVLLAPPLPPPVPSQFLQDYIFLETSLVWKYSGQFPQGRASVFLYLDCVIGRANRYLIP